MNNNQTDELVERDISGETVCGFRVAAYRETHPEHGDKYGHRYSEHWSTPNTRDPRVKVERLFTEEQLRAAMQSHQPVDGGEMERALREFAQSVPQPDPADAERCPWCLSREHWAGQVALCPAPSSRAIAAALATKATAMTDLQERVRELEAMLCATQMLLVRHTRRDVVEARDGLTWAKAIEAAFEERCLKCGGLHVGRAGDCMGPPLPTAPHPHAGRLMG